MSRTVSEMSPADRQAYRTYELRLSSHASTEAERVKARKKMEELEWKGKAGGIYQQVDDLRKRVEVAEGREVAGPSPVDNAIIEKLGERVTAVAEAGMKREEAILDVRTLAEEVQAEANSIRADLGKANKIIREDQKKVGNIQKRQGEDSKTVAKMMTTIEARLAKLEQFQTDTVADMVERASTAIYAEAESAAKAAVGKLMGD